nr:hypothetical protein [Tanacetum cinerariifolium]
KEDPADYPADRGDNDDDESSNDDDDDVDFKKVEEEKEEEEHWKRIRSKRDKFEQNQAKTGSVAKPGKV